MINLERCQHLLGGLLRIEHVRRRLEGGLISLPISLSDLQKSVEWEVDILEGGERLHVRVRAVREGGCRFREKLPLQEHLVLLERPQHLAVDLRELGQKRLVGYVFERGRHITLEEADVAVDLLDRDFRVDTDRAG